MRSAPRLFMLAFGLLFAAALFAIAADFTAPAADRTTRTATMPAAANAERDIEAVRFFPVHIHIDAGEHALAAWQFELSARDADVRIVGLEGGEHAAFRQPPYYDPLAMRGERVIAAAFSMNDADQLPVGRSRIATVHVQAPTHRQITFDIELQASATTDGRAIPATIHLQLQGQDHE